MGASRSTIDLSIGPLGSTDPYSCTPHRRLGATYIYTHARTLVDEGLGPVLAAGGDADERAVPRELDRLPELERDRGRPWWVGMDGGGGAKAGQAGIERSRNRHAVQPRPKYRASFRQQQTNDKTHRGCRSRPGRRSGAPGCGATRGAACGSSLWFLLDVAGLKDGRAQCVFESGLVVSSVAAVALRLTVGGRRATGGIGRSKTACAGVVGGDGSQ